MISFTGTHYQREVILYAVFFYVRSEKRDEDAATRFFKQAIDNNGYRIGLSSTKVEQTKPAYRT